MSPDLATYTPPAIVKAVAPAGADPAARAKGYTEGYQAGAQAARAEERARAQAREHEHQQTVAELERLTRNGVQVLTNAAAALDGAHRATADELVTQVHSAAIELAEAILGHELARGPERARTLLERVARTPQAPVVTKVRLSVADHQAAVSLTAEAGTPLPHNVELVADPALTDGQAIAEYDHGHLDASITTALDRARAALQGQGA